MTVWIREGSRRCDTQRVQRVAATGGILGAIAASSCCILPLVLFTLGVSGSWIGYPDEGACGSHASKRLVKSGLIIATILTVAAIGFNVLAPLFIS